MPLSEKGHKIMANMKAHYGSKKGEQVFYASQNSGKITGTHKKGYGGGGGSPVKFQKREGSVGD